MSDSLGMVLSKALFAHDPNLLACDLNATAKAAAEVSNLLGCLMATILAKDPDNFANAMQIVMSTVVKSAERTASKAAKIVPDLTNH
ncbi:hypothetical protein IVB27_32575 [Bradyrhizobium sp. 197]|uniref:hypothetical protein n=1 Tax=Bradyrhizobium sp. 197 TaxID=2782663 RepID=UPI001FFB981E|nr:hypothetical protein [Bradyrhizobium sp. 197]MCK1479351.1 hypothetical protein [Bradyrhizobium sp. 197]